MILECIEKNFKSANTISQETGISKNRVNIRLAQLRKWKEVVWINEIRGERSGKRPRKYRKAPDFS